MSLLDRIIDKLHGLFYNQNKSISFGSRLVAVIIAIITVASVFPTLAEESTPTPEPTQTTNSEETNPPPSLPTDSAEPEPSASESAEPEATPSEEETPKTEVAEFQPRITFRYPNSVAVDPRARISTLPQLATYGGGIGLLCINSNAIIDLSTKNLSNNFDEGELLVAGDLTQNVRITGELTQISALINSGGGLRVMASQSRLARTWINFSYVELTQPDLSGEFCGQGSNSRSIGFRALDLRMENAKGRIDFNKPSGQ